MAPVDYDSHFSAEAKRRVPPTLRKLVAEFAGATGTISMHAGIPPASAFPFKYFKAVTVDGTEIEIKDPSKVLPGRVPPPPPLSLRTSFHSRSRKACRGVTAPVPVPPAALRLPTVRHGVLRLWAAHGMDQGAREEDAQPPLPPRAPPHERQVRQPCRLLRPSSPSMPVLPLHIAEVPIAALTPHCP